MCFTQLPFYSFYNPKSTEPWFTSTHSCAITVKKGSSKKVPFLSSPETQDISYISAQNHVTVFMTDILPRNISNNFSSSSFSPLFNPDNNIPTLYHLSRTLHSYFCFKKFILDDSDILAPSIRPSCLVPIMKDGLTLSQ